jgi:hypothetical protein
MEEDQFVPSRTRTPAQRIRWSLRCAKEELLRHVTPLGRQSLHQLSLLQQPRPGKRCFIIGNGPSLRKTDLSLLRDEVTFGLNRIYLIFPETGFQTTYLVSVNRLVLEQCADEILLLPMPKFLPWSTRRYLPLKPSKDVIFLNTGCGKPGFHPDARKPLWVGATVTNVALQLAFHMGFEQVILIGVDHSFVTQGQAHAQVTSQGEDPNHFSPNYFGKGFNWNLPDLETSELAYHMARQAYEAAGRQVLDATIGGKLTVFPKVEYSSLFKHPG